MKKFKVTLNTEELTIIEAYSHEEALNQAVKLYGLEVDIEEL